MQMITVLIVIVIAIKIILETMHDLEAKVKADHDGSDHDRL